MGRVCGSQYMTHIMWLRVCGSHYVAHSMLLTVCGSQCVRIKMHIGFLVGNPEGKKPLGKAGCKWKDNITKDLKEIRNCSHCVHVAWHG